MKTYTRNSEVEVDNPHSVITDDCLSRVGMILDFERDHSHRDHVSEADHFLGFLSFVRHSPFLPPALVLYPCSCQRIVGLCMAREADDADNYSSIAQHTGNMAC